MKRLIAASALLSFALASPPAAAKRTKLQIIPQPVEGLAPEFYVQSVRLEGFKQRARTLRVELWTPERLGELLFRIGGGEQRVAVPSKSVFHRQPPNGTLYQLTIDEHLLDRVGLALSGERATREAVIVSGGRPLQAKQLAKRELKRILGTLPQPSVAGLLKSLGKSWQLRQALDQQPLLIYEHTFPGGPALPFADAKQLATTDPMLSRAFGKRGLDRKLYAQGDLTFTTRAVLMQRKKNGFFSGPMFGIKGQSYDTWVQVEHHDSFGGQRCEPQINRLGPKETAPFTFKQLKRALVKRLSGFYLEHPQTMAGMLSRKR